MSTHADLLRRAATLAHETAQAATEGPWATWDDLPDHGYTTVGDAQGVLTDERPFTEECNPVAHVYARHDAAHVTLWHPRVALAVAAWLESASRGLPAFRSALTEPGWDVRDDGDDPDEIVEKQYRHALAVARALIGELRA